MGSPVGFGEIGVDHESALPGQVAQPRPVMMAVGGLPQQPEIAVGGGKHIGIWRHGEAADGFVVGAPAQGAAPGLDHLADEVDAALYRLQDGLARIQLHAERGRQPCGEVREDLAQALWRFVENEEVVDVADVVPRAQLVLDVLVERIEVDVREKLAREIADRQAAFGRLVEQALVRRHQGHALRPALHLRVRPRVVEQDGVGQIHQPGFVDAPGEQLAQDGLVDADEEIGQVAFEVERRPAPVAGNAAHLCFEAARGVEGASPGDAGAGVGDESGMEALGHRVVEHMVGDAVGEGRAPDLARFGSSDDETDGAAGRVAALLQRVGEGAEVGFLIALERAGAVGAALVVAYQSQSTTATQYHAAMGANGRQARTFGFLRHYVRLALDGLAVSIG